MARVLAISSSVARGHVGLAAIVPALQALGREVIALPTVLLSNHPGHAHVGGGQIAADKLRAMLDALAANGWLGEIDAVLTGYLPSVQHVEFAVDAIRRVRDANPSAMVLCDPVLGDWPKGLYIDAAAADAIRERLIPHASLVKLNAFELGWLTGGDIIDQSSVAAAARRLCSAPVVATSVPAGETIANVLVEGGGVRSCRVPRLARMPNGTGDLLAALLLGHRLNAPVEDAFARAVAGVDLVARASSGLAELALVPNLGRIATVAPAIAEPIEAALSGWVAGVDGCPGGWLVVLRSLGADRETRMRLVPRFADVLALPEMPRIIAVDMPIGLPDTSGPGGRAADIEARSRLGARQSSLFAVPARAAVRETDYRAACETALRHSEPPRMVSKQIFHLFPKIREIDAVMTPQLQARVVECHPETAFWAMNGERSLDEPKKVKSRPHAAGLELRRRLLMAAGYSPAFFESQRLPSAQAGLDDLLDAAACAWTAERVLRGTAHRFPADPPLDARGLRQEIRA